MAGLDYASGGAAERYRHAHEIVAGAIRTSPLILRTVTFWIIVAVTTATCAYLAFELARLTWPYNRIIVSGQFLSRLVTAAGALGLLSLNRAARAASGEARFSPERFMAAVVLIVILGGLEVWVRLVPGLLHLRGPAVSVALYVVAPLLVAFFYSLVIGYLIGTGNAPNAGAAAACIIRRRFVDVIAFALVLSFAVLLVDSTARAIALRFAVMLPASTFITIPIVILVIGLVQQSYWSAWVGWYSYLRDDLYPPESSEDAVERAG